MSRPTPVDPPYLWEKSTLSRWRVNERRGGWTAAEPFVAPDSFCRVHPLAITSCHGARQREPGSPGPPRACTLTHPVARLPETGLGGSTLARAGTRRDERDSLSHGNFAVTPRRCFLRPRITAKSLLLATCVHSTCWHLDWE